MHTIIAHLLLFLSYAFAQDGDNLNPTGAGCLDPDGFVNCYAQQMDNAVACVAQANQTCTDPTTYSSCIQGCNGAHLASKLGCWIQSCWNQVYSCEYQVTAIQYLTGTDLVQQPGVIPFYPPPFGDLPGGCSCNLGLAWGNQSFIPPTDRCIDAASSGDQSILAECECCDNSVAISNELNTCPHSDLSILDFASTLSNTQNILDRSPDKCAVLDSNDSIAYCASTYGIDNYAAFPNIVNPLNLPDGEPGTEPLSNLEGTPFTVFGQDDFTLSLFPGFKTTITPAPFNAKNVANTLGGDVDSATIDTSVVTGAGSASLPASTGGGKGGGASPTPKPSPGSTGKSGTGSGQALSTGTTTGAQATKTGAGSRVSVGLSLAGWVAGIIVLYLW